MLYLQTIRKFAVRTSPEQPKNMAHAVIDIHKAVVRNPAWRMAGPVSLRLLDGEQLAIVGGNGAGKSMLVDIITGAHPILECGDGSYIHYDFAPRASKMVSDNIRCITFDDAYGPVDGRYYYQMRYNQGEMGDDWHIARLSSGELRRHQLRQVLEGNPRVLILDNPFIGLDVEARRMLDDTLTRLTAQTDLQVVTVLSKTDDMPRCVTHVVEVSEGRVGEKQERTVWEQLRADPTDDVPDTDAIDRMFGLSCLQADSSVWPHGTDAHDTNESRRERPSVLDFHNVTIAYGGRNILDSIDWTIHQGEHWALTGPNGSGKSTLLSLVCADNPQAYANDISLFGRRRGSGESIWDIKRNIGYVSPELHRAFLRNYPTIDVVASGLYDGIGLYRRRRREDNEPCLYWMRVFGVERYADTSFLRLSSGEQRLVLLARAFVKWPPLLILDEPLHGLDMSRRLYVRRVIDAYCRCTERTLVMVTHYADEFPRCIDHELTLGPSTDTKTK